MIPDVYENKRETLRRFFLFLHKFEVKYSPYILNAVPQGKNKKELYDCLKQMMREPRVKVISLNKLWLKYYTVRELRTICKSHCG